MNDFVAYEKNVESLVTRIRHTIRIKMNSTPTQIKYILSNVPDNATLSMIIGDGEESILYGEMIFDEEKVHN